MKCLNRNKTNFYFAKYISRKEILDEYGNLAGYDVMHDLPIKCEANISSARGEASIREFQETLDYDKVIVLDNFNPDIVENSILWVDVDPMINAQGKATIPHDYYVKRVAKSINSTSIAITKVKVNG